MIVHGEDDEGNETGIAKDALGNYLAMGHVLTGTEAGMNHTSNVEMLAIGMPTQIDNLYGSTISGDLGQSATVLNNQEPDSFIGEGTEATEAEMVGDIDGFNIGNAQQGKDKANTVKLSELLEVYYNGVYANENENRFATFESEAQVKEGVFEEQVMNFLNTYNYKNNARVSFTLGMNMGGNIITPKSMEVLLDQRADSEAKEAIEQFRTWLDEQQKDTTNNTTTKPDNTRILSNGGWVFVVSDPSRWQEADANTMARKLNKDIIVDTITASAPVYPLGVKAVVLDEGNGETFNAVADEQYKWVKVHITEGASEGTTGWVSNLFIKKGKR
jgi:hypothetical protein